MLPVNALMSGSAPTTTFECAPRDFPFIKSKKSLVKKHVTRAKWNELRDIKTKTSGFTLWKAIQVQCIFTSL